MPCSVCYALAVLPCLGSTYDALTAANSFSVGVGLDWPPASESTFQQDGFHQALLLETASAALTSLRVMQWWLPYARGAVDLKMMSDSKSKVGVGRVPPVREGDARAETVIFSIDGCLRVVYAGAATLLRGVVSERDGPWSSVRVEAGGCVVVSANASVLSVAACDFQLSSHDNSNSPISMTTGSIPASSATRVRRIFRARQTLAPSRGAQFLTVRYVPRTKCTAVAESARTTSSLRKFPLIAGLAVSAPTTFKPLRLRRMRRPWFARQVQGTTQGLRRVEVHCNIFTSLNKLAPHADDNYDALVFVLAGRIRLADPSEMDSELGPGGLLFSPRSSVHGFSVLIDDKSTIHDNASAQQSLPSAALVHVIELEAHRWRRCQKPDATFNQGLQ